MDEWIYEWLDGRKDVGLAGTLLACGGRFARYDCQKVEEITPVSVSVAGLNCSIRPAGRVGFDNQLIV